MKIGIISERLNHPITGVGTYTFQLIKNISTLCKRDEIYLIDSNNSEIFKDINKIIISPPIKYLQKKPYFWNLYSQFKLRRNNFDLDIIHSPENATLFIKLKNQMKIITVHDIIAYKFPKFVTLTTRLRYKYLLPRTLKTADKIIADSHNTKQDLINCFKVPKNKIKVIHLAADEIFKPLNYEEVNEFKRKYHINFPFILYVGNITENKNIPTLIKAFYMIKNKNIKHKLVIAGMKRGDKRVFEMIDQLNLLNEVIFTGYLPKEDLPRLYNAADLFVYPSFYEGFGLPPLEAMSCGCPVITSNTSSLPEVVGDAGIMIDPYDINGLSMKMYEILTNDDLREELKRKGLKRAKLFSWEKTAVETLKVYKEVFASKKSKKIADEDQKRLIEMR